ncbi:MAG: SRPBCC family protein [Chloroflexota bacterium]
MAVGRATAAWGRGFDPDRLAAIELRMWKAYYRRQPLRLLALLVQANREQARASWPRAVAAALFLARAAAGFGRATGDYDRFLPDIVRGYRALGLPPDVDAEAVARRELRWWVVRREIGLDAGEAAGDVIADLYATLYGVPRADVAEAGRLRGLAAELRDRGAADDPDGPRGAGRAYWPGVARLLRESYRSLAAAVRLPSGAPATGARDAEHAGTAEHADIAEHAGTAGDGAALAASPAANDYHFVTTWRLPATRDEITDVLSDAADLARWWPSVYLEVHVREPGDERGVGRVVDLHTKGWLPYTLRWRFRVVESRPPEGFTIAAEGDFAGRGVWTLREVAGAGTPGGPVTEVEYDWRIRAEKGLLRSLSPVMRPVFGANHRWAMARGEASLRLELARRRAAGDAAILAAIPEPPGPTFPHGRRRRR